MAKTTNRAFRSPDETWEAAIAIASARGETATSVLNGALERYVRKHRHEVEQDDETGRFHNHAPDGEWHVETCGLCSDLADGLR
jgi:hypothetical protein